MADCKVAAKKREKCLQNAKHVSVLCCAENIVLVVKFTAKLPVTRTSEKYVIEYANINADVDCYVCVCVSLSR